jgi:hypothetical protein
MQFGHPRESDKSRERYQKGESLLLIDFYFFYLFHVSFGFATSHLFYSVFHKLLSVLANNDS